MMTAAPAETWAFEPGTELTEGRRIVRKLGGGERYEAWLGWDDHLWSTVVFKMLRPTHSDRGSSRSAIEREADVLRSIAHPGIVRIFDADLASRPPYLVLEFLDGPRLSTLLRRYGPLTPEQLVPLALEIGSALAYLHNVSLLHLDVKPQNTIMGAPPRLIDMSIARSFDEVAALSVPLGTDSYMAPEQCIKERLHEIGPWTDVWGLGAMLFEAANGCLPFQGAGPTDTHPQLTAPRARMHQRIPPVLADLISRSLARNPVERPTLPDFLDEVTALAPDARDVATKRLRRRWR